MNNTPKWLDWNNIEEYDIHKNSYEYIYGIKDIQVKYKEFDSASVYVSKPFEIERNVMEVSLKTEDTNVISNVSNPNTNLYDTAIEYYVAFDESPTHDQWYPILPIGQTFIANELLIPGLPLRFVPDKTKVINVFKNDVKISQDQWIIYNDYKVDIIKRYDKFAKYTVSYYPDFTHSDPSYIAVPYPNRRITSYNDKDGQAGELFSNGTNYNGVLKLSKHPYVDYKRINDLDPTYNPIEVKLQDVTIGETESSDLDASTNPRTENITDYLHLNKQIITPYSTSNPVFEYIHDGNILQFGETFKHTNVPTDEIPNYTDANIRVYYEYMKVIVRIKIILRYTNTLKPTTTPSVDSYHLIIRELR
jgi:hypothetical protein